jgi:hypothetical protein
MKNILYLTDLYYQASGRNYKEEDLFITSKLMDHFNLLIGHPQQALAHLDHVDLIVFRNTGPVFPYQDYFNLFLETAREKEIPSFNSFDGKADIKGKQYLVQLSKENYPVIPTIESPEELERLGDPEKYIVKPSNGADSIGVDILTREAILTMKPAGRLVQPFLDLAYEVSFYYLNNEFEYALYAPDKKERWELQAYDPSPEDLAFGEKFIRWNNMKRGITRVDAARLKDGSLLLLELEDLNPFLSIDRLTETARSRFINHFVRTLEEI